MEPPAPESLPQALFWRGTVEDTCISLILTDHIYFAVSMCCVPSDFPGLGHLWIVAVLEEGIFYYCSHFADRLTQAQRGQVTCPMSQSLELSAFLCGRQEWASLLYLPALTFALRVTSGPSSAHLWDAVTVCLDTY